MAIAMGQPVNQINQKLECMKIDTHENASEKPEMQGELLHRSGSVSSSEATSVCQTEAASLDQHRHPGGAASLVYPSEVSNMGQSEVASLDERRHASHAASSYSSREEYPEYAFVAAPNAFVPPQGSTYAGYPAPVMNFHGYMPYSMEGVYYHNPFMEYNVVNNQPLYGSVPAGVQCIAQASNGYAQVYPCHYYQLAPVEQYNVTDPGLPEGGVTVPESQDPRVIMSNGYSNIDPHVGQAMPMAMFEPPVSCDSVAVPVAVTYSPGMLSASAPTWIQEPAKSKGLQKGNSLVGSQPTYQPNLLTNFDPAGKSTLLRSSSVSGTVAKSSSQLSGGVDAKANGFVADNSKHDRKRYGSVNSQVVASTVLNKGAWSSGAGGRQYVTAAQPSKASFGIHHKGLGIGLSNAEQYNSVDFLTIYDDAKHFIIKSCSEENVCRSIQHGVWASTPIGNEKLDESFQDAQRCAAGKANGCPVFLFFSVNGSGRFCGVAEMLGPVDYNKTMEFWERNKWSGSFPVKWHIIKDVPNYQLRRIVLQNNENKPVTSSRDTQEVNLQQGFEMLNIFKNYSTRASILDYFPRLPMSQKVVLDAKPQESSPQCLAEVGGQDDKGHAKEPGLETVQANSNALRVCNSGVKLRESYSEGKSTLGKAETTVPDPNGDKGGRKPDKENLMITGVAAM